MKLKLLPPNENKETEPKEKEKENLYLDPIGVWSVTTEGDCEGRTDRNLGVYYGHLAEIAFHLADKCSYSLCFKKYKGSNFERPTYQAKRTKVSVSLDIESNTWDMKNAHRKRFFRKFLDTDDVIVKDGAYFASVLLELSIK